MRSLDWKQLVGKIIHGNTCRWLVMKELSIFNATKVYVFSDSVWCLGKILENPQSNDAWDQRLGWLKSSQNYRNFDRIDGEPMEFEWNISKDSTRCSSVDTREFHKKNHNHVDVQRHLLWNKRQRNRMSGKHKNRISVCEKVWQRTMVIYWSYFWEVVVLYQWRQSTRNMGQYCWKDVVGIRRKQMSNFPRYEPIVQRSNQMQRTWKIVYTLLCRFGDDFNCFSHSNFYKTAQSLRSTRRNVWRVWNPSWKNGETRCDGASSSLVLSVIKSEVRLNNDDRAHKDLLLQRYGERMEKLSQQDKLIKFCRDARFLSVVENGQYFNTKDTGNLTKFNAVACREYTLPREEGASQP